MKWKKVSAVFPSEGFLGAAFKLLLLKFLHNRIRLYERNIGIDDVTQILHI